MNINYTIDRICRESTDLSPDEIEEIKVSAHVLPAMARLFDADAFIDCQLKDGTGDSIVVAEAKPVDSESSYKHTVVGLVATKEKEPAVYRTFDLSVTTKFMKAITQEDARVVQTVDPIIYGDRTIGVFIIEQRMEHVITGNAPQQDADEALMFQDIFSVENEDSDELNVADTIEEGLLFIDSNNRVVFRNKVAASIYSRLGFIEDIAGQNYERISLSKVSGLTESSIIQKVKVGSYHFSIKTIRINRKDISYLVIISDITAEAIQEKELVLKSVAFNEMHHRIKNNLQTIVSLLHLQRNRAESDETKKALTDTISRLLAISSTHEILLATDMDKIKLNDMMTSLKENTLRYYQSDDFSLEIECYGGDFDIEFDRASALSLVLSELIQNSIKYAFKGRNHGKIEMMSINSRNDEIRIVYLDNGSGFDSEKARPGSMGWMIVDSMVKEKLDGHVMVDSGNKGTKITIVFPL